MGWLGWVGVSAVSRGRHWLVEATENPRVHPSIRIMVPYCLYFAFGTSMIWCWVKDHQYLLAFYTALLVHFT